jgi:hypothetical protein
VVNFVRAKRLGYNEGAVGNVTLIDVLDPYDYESDDLEGEYITQVVANDRVGPYTQHLVNGQLADGDSIAPLTVIQPKGKVAQPTIPPDTTSITPGYLSEENYNPQSVLLTPGTQPPAPVIIVSDAPAHTADATVRPGTIPSSGGDDVTQVIEPNADSLAVSDAPWDGSASRFTDQQYKSATAACDASSGDTPKAQCFLPHHEPSGTVNRNGVHAAAGRVGQVKGKSAESIASAKSHLRSHYTKDLKEDPPDSISAALQLTAEERTALERQGECGYCLAGEHHVHDDLAAKPMPMPGNGKCPDGMEPSDDGKMCVPMTEESEDLGGKPSKGTTKDKRLRQNKMSTDAASDGAPAGDPQWRGVLVVEGSPTGDGREFAPDSIEWADMPLPLRWQKTDSHGGMPTNETVRVGNITRVWRDGANIMGEGFFDLGGPEDDDPHEAFRRMGVDTLSGISIDADDITDADIEYVFPDADGDEEEEDDIFFLLFAMPEKIVFHSARIRAATLCDIPAFVEAQIHLIGEDEQAAALIASATPYDPVTPHHTETSSRRQWDAAENERRLAKSMTHHVAESTYAWVDRAAVADGHVGKKDCKYIHHEVSEDGSPGAANLTACASLIAGLEGRTSIPKSDHRSVYTHLAQHLRDGNLEPQPFTAGADALLAHAWHDEWRPPREWFANPNLGQVTPIVVTEAGRVYGLAAQWGQCHLGFMSECVMPPHEDYHGYFMTGELVCDDGSRIAVGQITAGIEHAPLPMRAASATKHYEDTNAVVADVVVGNDQHGIWVAGAVRPWAQASRVASLRGSGQVSPDWRRIGGSLRMVALLTVNTSGYTVPRARSLVSSGEIQTLISSGMIAVQHHGPTEEELDKRALRLMQKALADRVHGRIS